MPVTLDIDQDTQRTLEDAFGKNLPRAVMEALAIEGYRSRKFGISTVHRLLGLQTRWEAEEWLRAHHIPLNYSLEDFQTDCRTLDELRKAQQT